VTTEIAGSNPAHGTDVLITITILSASNSEYGVVPETTNELRCPSNGTMIERSWEIEVEGCSSASILVTDSVVSLSNNTRPRQESSMLKEFLYSYYFLSLVYHSSQIFNSVPIYLHVKLTVQMQNTN
jgi:hypothetical protein